MGFSALSAGVPIASATAPIVPIAIMMSILLLSPRRALSAGTRSGPSDGPMRLFASTRRASTASSAAWRACGERKGWKRGESERWDRREESAW